MGCSGCGKRRRAFKAKIATAREPTSKQSIEEKPMSRIEARKVKIQARKKRIKARNERIRLRNETAK